MFDSSLGFAMIAWICIFVFVTNLRSTRRIDEFYRGHRPTMSCIHKSKVSAKGIYQVRASLGNLTEKGAYPSRYKLSFRDRFSTIVNAIGVKRTGTEQVAVINHYLEMNTPGLDKFKFNSSQVEIFLKYCNEVLTNYNDERGVRPPQVVRMYYLYLILKELARRYKLDGTETLMLRPLYAELFKNVPKVSAGVIDALATEALDRSGYGSIAAKYSTAMGLKMIYFYSPTFNKYGQIKQFKSATKF